MASALVRTARRSLRLAGAMATRRRLPFTVTFILTHRCNFRCAYCDIPDAAGDEMTAAEFCGAIDDLAGAGMARASFSGGEALLRDDACDVIDHARGRGMFTSLNTNGWLTEQHLDRLAASLDMLVLSLDGPADVHDLVRRRTGSAERVLQVIDAARARGVAVATITVLSGANLDVVDPVLALAREHEFDAYFQPAYSDCFDHARGLDAALTPSVFADLSGRLTAAKAAGQRVGASAGYLERLARGPTFGDCTRCAAGRYFGTVMPDGTVVPCHLTSGDHVYPNGRDVGFARAFLDMPRPKPGPGCAISPYQECDLVFGLDRRAITDAVRRMAG